MDKFIPSKVLGESIPKQVSGSHYEKLSPQPIEVIEKWKLSFHLGNALKYIARAGSKPGTTKTEDLQKAIWYLEREIELEKENYKNDK